MMIKLFKVWITITSIYTLYLGLEESRTAYPDATRPEVWILKLKPKSAVPVTGDR